MAWLLRGLLSILCLNESPSEKEGKFHHPVIEETVGIGPQ